MLAGAWHRLHLRRRLQMSQGYRASKTPPPSCLGLCMCSLLSSTADTLVNFTKWMQRNPEILKGILTRSSVALRGKKTVEPPAHNHSPGCDNNKNHHVFDRWWWWWWRGRGWRGGGGTEGFTLVRTSDERRRTDEQRRWEISFLPDSPLCRVTLLSLNPKLNSRRKLQVLCRKWSSASFWSKAQPRLEPFPGSVEF